MDEEKLISNEELSEENITEVSQEEIQTIFDIDDDFYKAKSIGISNRQLFKQAGNSIATNVIYYILKNLF